jgi:hypothetical protein
MFNWSLFFILIIICIPGVAIAAHGGMATIERLVTSSGEDQKLPPKNVLMILSALQSLVFVGIAVAVGTALVGRVGLSAPVFQAAAARESIWTEVSVQWLPALAVGLLGALVFIGAYYGFFRPRLDRETVSATEGLRAGLGIWGRVFFGGIVEEVLIRWGLMTLFLWLLSLLLNSITPVIYWIAIILSGLLFALGHIPGSLAAGAKKTPMFYAATLILNVWVSLVCGWLFWQYGLFAAMLAHALLHLIWSPIEQRTRAVSETDG